MAHVGKKVRLHSRGSFKLEVYFFHELKSCDGIGRIMADICGSDKIVARSELGLFYGKIKNSFVVFIRHRLYALDRHYIRSPVFDCFDVLNILKALRGKYVLDAVVNKDQFVIFIVDCKSVGHLICKIVHDRGTKFQIRIKENIIESQIAYGIHDQRVKPYRPAERKCQHDEHKNDSLKDHEHIVLGSENLGNMPHDIDHRYKNDDAVDVTAIPVKS